MTSDPTCLINGNWIPGGGMPFVSECPSNAGLRFEVKSATEDQVNLAFAAARVAFGTWWDLGSDARIEIAIRFAKLVEESSGELAALISRETGKPLWESKTEVAGVVGKVAVTIESFHERRDTTSFMMGDSRAVTRYKPHGVCGVLGPFNFPAHLPNGHIVPALISGNCVVFKPSELAPAAGAWMAQKWIDAGLPDGVLNLVHGQRQIGEAISRHAELDGLFFTGSSRAGVALNRTLAPTPQKILALEMGGNNPLIVHQAADSDAAAYLTILSAYLTSGQRCSCARRLIVVDGADGDAFLDTLQSMIGCITAGFYDDTPEPFMGTLISAAAGRRVLEVQDRLQQQGGQVLVASQSLRNCEALVSPGLIDVTHVANRDDEELFGPLLNVIRVPDFDSAIVEANRTAYGLSAALLSDNEDAYREFIHRIRAGVVNWNRQTTGASGKLPFGGCGLSGNHRPSAYHAVDYCSFPVASLESGSLSMPKQVLPGLTLPT